MTNTKDCPECSGTGELDERIGGTSPGDDDNYACPVCRGTGKIPEQSNNNPVITVSPSNMQETHNPTLSNSVPFSDLSEAQQNSLLAPATEAANREQYELLHMSPTSNDPHMQEGVDMEAPAEGELDKLREQLADIFENQAPLVLEYLGHDRYTNEYAADGGWDGAMLYEYADQVIAIIAAREQALESRLRNEAATLVLQEVKAAEERKALRFMAMLLTDNGGEFAISNRAFVEAPTGNFEINSYEEPATNRRVYRLNILNPSDSQKGGME